MAQGLQGGEMNSRFILTYRLQPESSFSGFSYKLTASGITFDIKNDLVWMTFEATTETWEQERDEGVRILRTLLSVITLQVEYPFEVEPIQWIEDRPTEKSESRDYILGQLAPIDPRPRAEPPNITGDQLERQWEIHLHLCSIDPYFRMAVLDYTAALRFAAEAVVFCARSIEWIEEYFGSRSSLRSSLRLSKKYTTEFFRIANDTTIARHVKDPTKVRAPTIEEIRFCVFFSRIVVDRFATYLWHRNAEVLPMSWPEDLEPGQMFTEANSRLTRSLRQTLSGELA